MNYHNKKFLKLIIKIQSEEMLKLIWLYLD